MVVSMATTKITITIPNEQVAEMGALVAAGRAVSTSAFVKHAISIALSDAAGWQEMLDDALGQTGGPLTNKERAWADSTLKPETAKQAGPRKKSKPRKAA